MPVTPVSNERGTSALLIAGSLILLMGMAAIAIDLGAGFNERRQDQSAADVGVMAGVLESLEGADEMRDQALSFVRRNLTTQYSDAEWQTIWEGCTDPNKNDGGFNFQPVAEPAAWGGESLDCINVDGTGFFRVRVPDQLTATTFARVIGLNELTTSAAAIAQIGPRLQGGILPFGVLAGAGGGTYCIAVQPSGTAQPPCNGGQAGNFGTIDSPLFGNPDLGTQTSCSAASTSGHFDVNIAVGIDHFVTLDDDGENSNHVLDQCFNFGVDTLYARQGASSQANSLLEGLVSGPIDFSLQPKLQQGSQAKRSVYDWQLDNVPLWDYLLPNGTEIVPDDPSTSTFDESVLLLYGTNAPANCAPTVVMTWENMDACLQDYSSGTGFTTTDPVQIFNDGLATTPPTPSLSDSPRFAYVPLFWESTWPSGNSQPRHIEKFRSIFLDGVWLAKGTNQEVFRPGDPSGTFGGNSNGVSLRQVTGFLIPDDALPDQLRGDPPPWADGLNPFVYTLYR